MIEIWGTGFPLIKEIDGISMYYGNDRPRKMLRGICYSIRQKYKKIARIKFKTIIFTGVVNEEYSEELFTLIKEKKLGDIMSTASKRNPNSQRFIKTYVWNVNRKALSRWFRKNRLKDEAENR